MTVDPTLVDALAPVSDALLAAARQEAEHEVDRARTAAARTLADAATEAKSMRSRARERGAADAAAALTADRARARRAGRATVLAARREAYEALCSDARRAVAGLREDPGYAGLCRQMANAIRQVLGPDAEVRESQDGGMVGEAHGRRLDYSLSGFADRAMQAMAHELEASGPGAPP
jgi:vacuolar-type H+-ATPase subunit E/Vma4